MKAILFVCTDVWVFTTLWKLFTPSSPYYSFCRVRFYIFRFCFQRCCLIRIFFFYGFDARLIESHCSCVHPMKLWKGSWELDSQAHNVWPPGDRETCEVVALNAHVARWPYFCLHRSVSNIEGGGRGWR